MKILFVSPRYEGGIGGHAFRVAEKMRDQGHNVKLMQIPHIPIKKLKNPSFTIFGILKSITDKEKYDAVHAWNIPSAFVMKYVNSPKKILSVHGAYSEQVETIHSKALGSLASKVEPNAFNLSDKLTTDSKAVQKYYKDKANVNFIYLPAPLDIEKFRDINEIEKKKNQIVYIGRDSYEKGIDILKGIESQINGNVVYCTNFSWKKTMNILKSSSILVVPSRMESIPQVIKEAFYLKVPVIATNVGGIPEIIEDHDTGILIPSENPSKMLSAINSLLDDEKLQKIIVENAYNFIIKNFTWDTLLSQYLELYAS